MEQLIYSALASVTAMAGAFIIWHGDSLYRAASAKRPYVFSLDGFLAAIEFDVTFHVNKFRSPVRVFFVLNELNDLKEPYFGFVSRLIKLGCTIVYTSDRVEVVRAVPDLRQKLIGTRVVEEISAHTIVTEIPLRDGFPMSDNLCFIVSLDGQLLSAFSAYRYNRSTIGGARLPPDEAEKEWKDLGNVRAA